jgi:lysozyme
LGCRHLEQQKSSEEFITNNMYDKVKDMLIRHEGVVCTLYQCSQSRWTIGAGRNLQDRGITEEEAMYLLDNDIKRVMSQLDEYWTVWRSFPEKAQLCCVDMTFQMGIKGFMGFRRTRALMEMGMWLEASEELLDSKYAIQTPNRANYNSRQLALCTKDGKENIGRPPK